MSNNETYKQGEIFSEEEMSQQTPQTDEGPVTVLGITFDNDAARREYFRAELRKKLPELRKIEGFPIGSDDDIINLSDPPYYTACPNPWLNDFIAQWEEEKKELVKQGKRVEELNVDEPYAYGIREQKNNPIYVAHSYHTKVPPEVIMNYYLYYTQPGDVILDGFAGTGMAGVASNLCGQPTTKLRTKFNEKWNKQFGLLPNWGFRNCVLGDLSPITSYIAYNYCNSIDSKLFLKAANDIYKKLESELGYLYELNDPQYGKCKIIYFVWSEKQTCPNCGKSFVLWDQAVDISKDEQKDVYPCPSCSTTIQKRSSQKLMVTEYDDVLNETITTISMTPVFVSFVDPQGHRHERELTKQERVLYNKVPSAQLSQIPISFLHEGDKTSDPHRIGIFYLHQFYSKRNLLILSRFKELIENFPCGDRMKGFLNIWFSSAQSRLHMMNRYAVKHHRHVGPLSNTLYVSSTPAEISPFYFIKSKIKDNNFDIVSNGNVVNQISSATTTQLPDECVDYIFTDPPFGSNIMYSELNFLWESWLGIRTNNKEEAIVNKTQNKGLPDYQGIMLRCFREYYRVLKPGKWITIEFSNTSAAVWNSIQLALQQSGFVVSSVSDLNKGRAGLHGIIGVVAVNQDLAISCYKPSSKVVEAIYSLGSASVWSFVDDFLEHLAICTQNENSIVAIAERSPKILFDRMVSYFVEKGVSIPLDASQFQQGLRERYVEKDGMFFTAAQAAEYEEKKKMAPEFVPMGIIVSDEANGIAWLKNQLRDTPKTYQELQPEWMQAINGVRKGDILPELKDLLEENFIEEDGRWREPNIHDDVDKEAMRTKALLREFKLYVEQAQKPKSKIKEARVEALRAGFKQCYMDKDFKTIVLVGDKIPQNLRDEDEVLLQFYDIALNKI